MRQIILLTLLMSFSHVHAQDRFTISGYFRDMASGENLIGATITLKGNSRGVSSNQYGFYSLTLPKGQHQLIASYIGYYPQMIYLNLEKDTVFNVSMVSSTQLSEDVVVVARKRDNNVKVTQMGKISMPIEQIKSIPAFLGEVDILKAIQLIPGVRNAGEGSAGFYVRGGGPDQNLILLDDAVVYNSGHLFGFFSVFNADAIKNVTLIKGGMPAQYGGRLSSVLDVAMKEGNNQKFEVDGGVGLIASRLSIQGPIKKNKASFIVSARRTYIDALIKPFVSKSSQFYGSGYYFFDLNAKVNYSFSPKNRLYLSGYFGRDVFDFRNSTQSLEFKIPWGNSTGTLRWNHVFNNKLFLNTTAVYNDYNFNFSGAQNNFKINIQSGIRDLSLKQDYDYYPFSQHKIRFGFHYTWHRFTPSVVSGNQDSVQFRPNNAQQKYAHEAAIYLQDTWDVTHKLSINAGIRGSYFMQVGPNKIYQTDDNGNRVDSLVFGRGKKVKSYGGLEPRLTLRYAINDMQSLKASVTRNLQYIHLVSNAGTTLPTDVWVPSTYLVKPQLSWLYALGYFRNFHQNMFETSLELYYKSMQHQIEYKEGYTPSTIEDTENSFTFGRGWSYGAELFIHKVKGKFTGWLGYTLSYTWRKFPELNFGKKFPAKYDRRHDLSLVGMYELNKKWKFGATFVFGTGNAATLPQRFYIMGGVLTQEYSSINQYRLPSYHRLDISATLTPKRNATRKVKREWVFSVFNAYSRKNPFFIYFDQTGSPYSGDLKIQAKQVSIFPILPSVTYNLKF